MRAAAAHHCVEEGVAEHGGEGGTVRDAGDRVQLRPERGVEDAQHAVEVRDDGTQRMLAHESDGKDDSTAL